MLYHLLYPLSKNISFFNLFKYITFRTACATVTALLLSLILGPYFIRKLKERQVKEKIRAEGPASHLTKEGTPTMGGLIILFSVVLPTALWADFTNRYIQIILLTTIWMGLIGFMDDYLKAIKHQPKGLVGRKKLIGQVSLGLVLGALLYFFPPSRNFDTATEIPFIKNYFLDFGILYIPFVMLVLTGSSNAVNLTDGLDGLAIGLTGLCAVAFAGIAYVTGRTDFSRYLGITYLEGSGELTIFCGTLIGAALGFLWFNSYPAEVFMGDTGALALGGSLGIIAVMVKKELLLVIVGGVFVAEALSVILQVSYFKWSKGKRIFKMAPLHHHFELSGWKESKVVVRFWIAGAIFALLTLSTLKIR
ncbi:MAG: phospho-N-acetylmuramoyl-pentapeptide-transferase [candidate division Zixibacteria bacterium]|nr:phospho-N-acetylmuramoyl-pentapeptide-transferase [candidate division Zixibacteria bacterium]